MALDLSFEGTEYKLPAMLKIVKLYRKYAIHRVSLGWIVRVDCLRWIISIGWVTCFSLRHMFGLDCL